MKKTTNAAPATAQKKGEMEARSALRDFVNEWNNRRTDIWMLREYRNGIVLEKIGYGRAYFHLKDYNPRSGKYDVVVTARYHINDWDRIMFKSLVHSLTERKIIKKLRNYELYARIKEINNKQPLK